MNEMSATVQEVARNASHTATASTGADNESKAGVKVASEALDGIEVLIAEIEKAAEVIQRVESDSASIDMVLGDQRHRRADQPAGAERRDRSSPRRRTGPRLRGGG